MQYNLSKQILNQLKADNINPNSFIWGKNRIDNITPEILEMACEQYIKYKRKSSWVYFKRILEDVRDRYYSKLNEQEDKHKRDEILNPDVKQLVDMVLNK